MEVVRISYGSIALFWSILHNVFLLYYVEIFVSVYKIDKTSFWIGEVGTNIFFYILYFMVERVKRLFIGISSSLAVWFYSLYYILILREGIETPWALI